MLVVNRKLRVADDVDEQHMGDLEREIGLPLLRREVEREIRLGLGGRVLGVHLSCSLTISLRWSTNIFNPPLVLLLPLAFLREFRSEVTLILELNAPGPRDSTIPSFSDIFS